MDWDQIEEEWKQRRGEAVHLWEKIMNDDLAAVTGKYEELVGSLQKKYSIAGEEANQRSDDAVKNTPGKRLKVNRNPEDGKRVSR